MRLRGHISRTESPFDIHLTTRPALLIVLSELEHGLRYENSAIELG